MTVEEFAGLIDRSDKVRIIKGGQEEFTGWLALLEMQEGIYGALREETVRKFRAVPELRHREWKERGLAAPLEPEETPEYSFSDLRMTLYYTIYI